MSTHAIGYCRVSTTKQADEGMSLDAQTRLVTAAAAQRGLTLDVVTEGKSGKSLTGRPALQAALTRLKAGEAQTLIAPKLDRLARSVVDLVGIVDRSNREGWRLILLDLDLDTATPQGRLVVTIMAGMAEFERALISERQKESHAHRRDEGQVWGRTAGPRTNPHTVQMIKAQRANGLTLQQIADTLTETGVPTPRGGKWWPGTVSHILNGAAA